MEGNNILKQDKISNLTESDEVFAFIAGYTSGGVPYGVTWEEMKKINQVKLESVLSEEEVFLLDHELLPFE